MDMNAPILRKRDTYLYNFRNIAIHFLGDKWSRFIRESVDRWIEAKLKEAIGDLPPGQLLPVERRRDLSPRAFKEDFARKRPVVFEGAALDWPCAHKWSQKKIAEMYGTDEVLLFDPVKNDKGKVEYEFSTLGKAIAYMQRGHNVNIRFNPLLTQHPELKDDINWNWYRDRVSCSLPGSNQLQMFIGAKQSSTHIHTALSENLFLQVEGEKRWVIYPPKYHPVFKIHIDRTPYFISDLVHDDPDPNKFPHFDKVVGYECVLQPGDILYNPSFFWHFVTSISPSVSLGYRWIDPISIWKLDPTLGFLTICSFNPPIWRITKHKDDFTKVLTDNRNLKAIEKHFRT